MAISITTAQQKAVSELYVAFFNRAADSEGLGFWAGALASGKSIASVAQDMYLTAPARAYYSTALTNEQFIKAFYATVLNRATPDAEGVAFWTAALNQPSATQGSVAVQIMKAVRDYVDTPSSPTNAAALTAKTLFAAKVDVSTAYALQGGTVAGASTVLTGVVDAATAAAAIANLGSGTIGSTFTLTTGIDSIVGTTGNDTISAVIDTTAVTGSVTLSVADVINAGAGTDTLNVTLVNATATLPAAAISGVEVLNLRNVSSTAAQSVAGLTGLTQVNSTNSLVDTVVTGVASSTAVGVTGSATNLTATYATGAFAAGSNVAINVNAAGTKVGAVVTQSTITLDVATAVGAATSASIAATGANYIKVIDTAGFDVAAAGGIKTLTVTGSGSVVLDATSALAGTTLAADLTKVDASANTGGLTASVANIDVVVTGGSGADTITLANGAALSSKAGIALGAGNDKLLNNASAGVGTSAVIDGGAGTDTIAATLLQVGNQANIKNFEVLDLAGETRTIDASLFTASTFNSVALSAALGGATVVQKLAGTALNLTVTASSGANDLTASLAGAATGTTDVANVTFSGGAATLQSFKSAGIETYNIASGGTVATTANAITSLSDSLNTTSSIVITGANALTLGGVTVNTADLAAKALTATADTAAALTTIDGSAATGNLNITAGASQQYGALNFFTTFTGLKITTGSGDDVVVSAAKNAVVVTGAGDDTVTITGSGASVNTGAAKTATGDIVNFGGTNQSAVFGTGVQTAVIQLGAAAGATFDKVTSITGAATGDKIDFAAILTTAASVDAITNVTTAVAAAASLTAALDLAAAAGGVQADGSIVFFTWADGNTYLVGEKAGAADGLAAIDAVVKLVGSYTNFAATDGVVTLG